LSLRVVALAMAVSTLMWDPAAARSGPPPSPPPGPPPHAKVKSYRVDWRESVDTPSGRSLLRIHVSAVVLTIAGIEGPDQGRWHASVSFTNVGSKPVSVGRKSFAMLVSASQSDRGYAALAASQFRPFLPRTLKPGAGWTGRIDGFRPLAGTPAYVRLAFGPFSSSLFRGGKPFVWVTDHGIAVRS